MPFTVTMPKLSPTMVDGTIAKWHKKEGEYAEAGELLFEVTTDKATVEHNALDEGWLRKILVQEGETAAVNQPIAIFSEGKEESIEDEMTPDVKKQEPIEESTQPPSTPAPASERSQEEKIAASPLAKRLAKERGVDLREVKGTGPRGRIVSRDLEEKVAKGNKEIPLSQMRKAIARRLQESKRSIPHFYLRQIINAEPLVLLQEELRSIEIKVSYNDWIVRACALAIKEHPNMNCSFQETNQTTVQFSSIDLAIAVGLQEGLITPIVKNADEKMLTEISREIRSLAECAHAGKLRPEEYEGGSFCISNLGMFGVTDFLAIINPPQAAILAVGAIRDCPVVRNGEVVAGKEMAVSLSVDHRIIDGVAAARFMKTLQTLLESPLALII